MSAFLQIEKFRGDVTIPQDVMARILAVLVNHDRQPMYLHCLDGTNITGLVVMCLRKLQMRKRPLIVTEFSRFLYEDPEEEELTYLRSFRHELAMPVNVPQWLWAGVRPRKAGLIPLKYPEGSLEDQQLT